MEADLQTQDPVTEPDSSPLVPSEESARSEASDAAQNATMNAFLRGELDQGATSKSDDADADGRLNSAQDGASAPSGGVKPSDAPAPGRRGAAAEIARLTAEKAQLEAEVATYRPKPVDASAEAQKAAVEREQRYRRLRDKPDSDQDWTNDDWSFVQDEKTKRALVPELQAHYDTIIADDLKSHQDAYNGWVRNFKAHVASDLASAKDLPGVDLDAVKTAATFAERDRIVYAAGAARSDAEVKRLRQELSDARRDLLGSVRTPMSGGRSSPGRTYSETDVMNAMIRGGR